MCLQELKGPPPVEWDAAFEELSTYAEKHGDTKVPEKTFFGGQFLYLFSGLVEVMVICGLSRSCVAFEQKNSKTLGNGVKGNARYFVHLLQCLADPAHCGLA